MRLKYFQKAGVNNENEEDRYNKTKKILVQAQRTDC
jgi:hypothetical protein